MRFDLTPEIVDQVIFAMENQETPFVFDSDSGTVVAVPDSDSVTDGEPDGELVAGRYVEIPEWSSADGFQLMERFVATLRNPLVREKLRAALAGGKGVFRNFKNVLKAHEEIERLWFSFKDREMHSRVVEWYNDLCDLWGWERMGLEPDEEEETGELVLSDFEFEEERSNAVQIIHRYDRESWDEATAALPAPIAASFYRHARQGVDPEGSNNLVLSARTPGGEFAGFVWGIEERGDERASGYFDSTAWLRIVQLYVTREFRGLGIAKSLVDQVCRSAYSRGVRKIVIDVVGSGEVLLQSLEEEGFSSISRSLVLDVEEWGRDNAD